MSVESILGLRIAGNTRRSVTLGPERPLTEEDVLSLDKPRDSTPPPIVKLRERHHSLARIIASGEMDDAAASIITGYSASRISILRADPTFQALVEHYRENLTTRYYDMHQKLADLGEATVDEIAQRIEDGGESMDLGDLLNIAKFAADRSGHGPSSTQQVDVRVGLADKLEAARQSALAARQRVIDITPKEE